VVVSLCRLCLLYEQDEGVIAEPALEMDLKLLTRLVRPATLELHDWLFRLQGRHDH